MVAGKEAYARVVGLVVGFSAAATSVIAELVGNLCQENARFEKFFICDAEAGNGFDHDVG
jgi:hypothetical protein